MHSLTTCRMAATAIPGNCQPATNQYTVSGTVSFSFIPAGILTIIDDGANTNVKSTAYSLSGIISGGRLHTITFTFSNLACAPVSLTYLSPTSCTAVACPGLYRNSYF